MTPSKEIPIDTRPLFKPLDKKLIELLKSLNTNDWHKQTVAKEWKVKDVVSHLLDGSLRALSIQRDKYFGESPPVLNGYEEIVTWLNKLNADWVNSTKRISPQTLILLLESTGHLVSEYYESLDPFEIAIFPVDWAGESTSLNWMHVAREYTEKWHHQQQIRDATNRDGIMSSEFFYPAMNTFFQALPHSFRNEEAGEGTLIKTTIASKKSGGDWFLTNQTGNWVLSTTHKSKPDVTIEIPAEISWKLFSKSLRPEQIIEHVTIEGDERLAKKVLDMVSVMA